MNKKRHSGAFMMEMIAVVCFFVLCASVCIMIFVKADQISRKANDLNRSVTIAQSVAEVWKAEGPAGLQNRFHAEDMGSGVYLYVMSFDSAGSPAAEEEAVYHVTVSLPDNERTDQTEIRVSKSDEPVYQLSVSKQGSLP